MTETAHCPVAHLDFTDPALSLRSETVHRARTDNWYATTTYGLAVLRYDAVKELLRDRRLRQGSWAWPEKNGVTSGLFHTFWSNTLINFEGEDHARLRRLHNPAFSPKAITSLTPRFQALANELIDAFVADERCDFVAQFSNPYAARVIAILLGLPEEDWPRFTVWAETIGLALTVQIKDRLDDIDGAFAELYEYVDAVIANRREEPQDDFISRLIETAGTEQGMSDSELRDAIANGIFAGMDTTRNQIGLAMQLFLDHPDQWETLAQRPELAAAAVEEVMRVSPTVTWVTREALVDFDYRGVAIPAGTTLHLLTEAAGTDPEAFDNPAFDITAEDRAPHFGFGGGAHHCLGHFVARSDMTEAFALLASRLTGIEPLSGAEWLPVSGNTGPISLPIAFQARV